MQSTIELLESSDPDVYAAILGEEARERDGIEGDAREGAEIQQPALDEL